MFDKQCLKMLITHFMLVPSKKMFDESFTMFCDVTKLSKIVLASKCHMFDKQWLVVWPGPKFYCLDIQVKQVMKLSRIL